MVVRSPCQENNPADAHTSAQVSAGVGKPPHGFGVCIWVPFPFVLSFASFCAPHHFRRLLSALHCYLPLCFPFPLPWFLWALHVPPVLGGKGEQQNVLPWGGEGGGSSSCPYPLLPLASKGLFVGLSLLGVGGFGRLLLLAHISQSVLGVVSLCLLVCWPQLAQRWWTMCYCSAHCQTKGL